MIIHSYYQRTNYYYDIFNDNFHYHLLFFYNNYFIIDTEDSVFLHLVELY